MHIKLFNKTSPSYIRRYTVNRCSLISIVLHLLHLPRILPIEGGPQFTAEVRVFRGPYSSGVAVTANNFLQFGKLRENSSIDMKLSRWTWD